MFLNPRGPKRSPKGSQKGPQNEIKGVQKHDQKNNIFLISFLIDFRSILGPKSDQKAKNNGHVFGIGPKEVPGVALGSILEPFWDHFGTILGPFLDHF